MKTNWERGCSLGGKNNKLSKNVVLYSRHASPRPFFVTVVTQKHKYDKEICARPGRITVSTSRVPLWAAARTLPRTLWRWFWLSRSSSSWSRGNSLSARALEKPHNRENEPTTWCAGEGYPPTCAVRPKIRTALSAVRGHAVVGLWFEGVSFVVRSGFGRNSLRGISESRMFLHFVIFKTILRKL